MVCYSASPAASSSTYGSSVSTTIRRSRDGPTFAGASSANARTRRPSGGSFVAGSPGDDSPGTTGSRSPTSAIPPWSLPSRWCGYTPTACIASQPSLTLPASRLPTWSIAFSLAIRLDRPSGAAQVGRAGWLHAINRGWRKHASDRDNSFSEQLSAITMIEPDELSGVVVQPEEVLAPNRPAALAGAGQGEYQPATPQ